MYMLYSSKSNTKEAKFIQNCAELLLYMYMRVLADFKRTLDLTLVSGDCTLGKFGSCL
jgi:hypothetical protein